MSRSEPGQTGARRMITHVIVGSAALHAVSCNDASKPAPEGGAMVVLAPLSASLQGSAEPRPAPAGSAQALPPVAPVLPRCPPGELREARQRLFDPPSDSDFLPRAEPRDVGVDGADLDAVITGAERAHSDTLLVIKDGQLLVERAFTRDAGPIELRSITKGIAALAIAALVADGAIKSLDEPLSTFFPEFAVGDKARITLRHVLTHTSGLRHAHTNADALNAQADRTAYARALSVVDAPGSVFSYSNEASQLLSGIIARAAGEPADSYAARRLFEPLGIRDFSWKKDRAGNVQTYYGLGLRARDLAKIGLLLLGEGSYRGRRVLPPELARGFFEPSARYGGYGLSFWLDPSVSQRADKLALLRLSERDVAALGPLEGVRFASSEAYFARAKQLLPPATHARLRTLHRERRGPLESLPGRASALIALGGLGQRLEVHPDAQLVVVRQHIRRPGDDAQESLVTFRALQELTYPLSQLCRR